MKKDSLMKTTQYSNSIEFFQALEALEGDEFANGDLRQWRTEHKGAVSEEAGKASQLANHEVRLGLIRVNRTQIGRHLTWCFSLIGWLNQSFVTN